MGRHRALWRFRATGAEAATARHRGCASALLQACVRRGGPIALPAFPLSSNGVQRHRRVRTRRIQVSPPAWSTVGRTRCGASVAGSKRYFDEMAVGGQVPSAHVQARKRPTCP